MDITPKEQAERIVMDHLKILSKDDNAFKPASMGKAKQFAEYSVMKIVEEIRINLQDTYKGIERLEYWKEVKRKIKSAFSND